ncbi:hypothetical protein CBR_g52645 [Chara braunii]|uniref:Integrase catalytic domain-containing protein n=1 Tax=Chara braunii TaxID=69332 RepID=A0A388MAK5_CHABU|nr:hypothetical protein CBR_g52645 [Chara braunii]|eukprot:GBG91611.1 hypothetical protein CBR_g52645 [Chara braunii]
MPAGENGRNYIFDARDNLIGFADGRAIRTKTDPVLANCIEEYYMRYPFVKEFVMDRGSEFTCNEVRTLLTGYGVVANYTTAADPQANAPLERGHSTITNLLAKWTEGKPGQWPKFLRATFFVENITVKRTTKSDFSKTAMQKGGRGVRPRQRPQGASGREDSRRPFGRESTPIFNDDNIELFLDSYQAHAAREGWSTLERIRHLKGVGRFEEPIAHIREEALTWQDVETRMQRLRASPLGPDGLPIRLEEGNAEEFIPAYEHDLRGPSPTLPEEGKVLPLRTPLDSLEAHLDASQWGASQSEVDQGGPAWYEPVEDEPEEEPPEPGPEVGPRGPEGPQTEGVIIVGDDTPPPAPILEQARQYWPQGIHESDSKVMLGPPSKATTPPSTQAEPEESERARAPTTVAPQVTEPTDECMDVEALTSGEPLSGPPPAEEGTSERDPLREAQEVRARRPSGETKEEKHARVQIWDSYEGKRDAVRLRSREAGQEDARVDEVRETGDLWFSATKMAIERTDRRIREVAVSSFQQYSMLSNELAASRLEVEQLSTQLEEERAENQAWRSRMEAKEAEWEKRLQDMAAMVERLSATKVVDWTEQSRYGIQGKEVQGLFGQEGMTEPPQEGEMGKVFLDPTEVAARREAEEGRFSFRTPTELASPQATLMTFEIPEDEPAQRPRPHVAGGGPAEGSPTILLEVQEGALTGAVASTEPEAMEGEASQLDALVAAMELDMPSGEPQRQETPKRVREMGEQRTQLGSWATGADSWEYIS